MTKKHLTKKRRLAIVVSVVCGLILAITLAMVWAYTVKVSEERSNVNIELTAEATEKKDVTICDQIRGGIAERKGEGRTLPDGAIADSFGHPAMTESEAKAQCRNQVMQE